MIWAKAKTIVGILLLVLVSEVIRHATGLPITLLDVIILPITGLLIYAIRFYNFPFGDSESSLNTAQNFSVWKLIGFVVFCVGIAVMGAWLAWIGIQEPLGFFSGTKGAAHGYSLVQIGVICVLYGIGLAIAFSYKLFKLLEKSSGR